jgi:hypothetical protein
MSRTYRSGYEWKYMANGNFYTYDEIKELFGKEVWRLTLGWTGAEFHSKRKLRDGNTEMMTSPPKDFKRLQRRQERRNMDADVRDGKPMRTYKKRDRWDWW